MVNQSTEIDPVEGIKNSADSTSKNSTASKSRKRMKGSKKAAANDDMYDSEMEKLKSRFLKKKSKKWGVKEEDAAPYLKRVQSGDGEVKYKLHNPYSHSRMLARIEDNDIRMETKPSDQMVESPWLCAFCQLKTCQDDLGDLFGSYPYQLPTASSNAAWPPFLKRTQPAVSSTPEQKSKDTKSPRKETPVIFFRQSLLNFGS